MTQIKGEHFALLLLTTCLFGMFVGYEMGTIITLSTPDGACPVSLMVDCSKITK